MSMSTGGLYRSGRVVEARQVTATNAAELAAWCGGRLPILDYGDWIVKGENGFEVWAPADFEAEFSPEPAVES